MDFLSIIYKDQSGPYDVAAWVLTEWTPGLVAKRFMGNSAVGFEAANHYFATRSNLMEKVVQCGYLLHNK